MTPPPALPAKTSPARLLLSPRANRQGPLYPGQTADFDVTLENPSAAPLTVNAIEGNLDTPAYFLYGPRGPIGRYDTRSMTERMVGHGVSKVQPAPEMVDLPPGGRDATWVNLWNLREPLPPGAYSFEAVHRLDAAGATATAPKLAFEIVPARVAAAALGYDSRMRAQSQLAWLAAPAGAPTLRLMLRESGTDGHGSLHQGGHVLGEFRPGTRVALSQLAWDAPVTPIGWVAALATDGSATLFRHASAFLQGSPVKVNLGLRDPSPIERFPNRGHAVLLATGLSAKGPVLAGVSVSPAGAGAVWTIDLPALPKLAACSFMKTGSIQVLLVFDDGKQSAARLFELDESGKLLKPVETVRSSPNSIAAIAAGQRSPLAFFYLLEADRARHDRMALLRIGAAGGREIKITDLGRLRGWPSSKPPDDPNPLPAQAMRLEQAVDGAIWLAMTDPQGNLYAGNVEASLELIREAKGDPIVLPHCAAMRKGASAFGFTSDGSMYLPAGSHSH